MSGEDSKQLSVAELLARNAAQGASTPSSGGGGRRRRSGRGVSVTDLTGENATVRPGPSSHAAPAPPRPDPTPAYTPEPAPPAYEPPASYEPPAYEPPAYEPPAGEPAPYPPPGPAEPAYSPMSGPITRFDPHAGHSAPDPLGLGESRPATDPFGPFRAEARDTGARSGGRGPGRLAAPGASSPVDPGIAEMFGSGALPAVSGGRRRRADDEPEVAQYPQPPQAPPVTGGRAARRRAAEAAEEAAESAASWSPSASPGYAAAGYDATLHESGIDAPQAFMGRPGQSRGFGGESPPGFATGQDAESPRGYNGNRGGDSASGFHGLPGTESAPGYNGYPGAEHASGFNGFPGADPAAGFNGYPGADPAAGFNGYPSAGPASGYNGFPGAEPASGFNGFPNADPAPGANGYPPPAADATQAFDPAPRVDDPAADPRPSLDRRRGAGKTGALPSWSARRHRPDPAANAANAAGWSPVSQEQPLVAGQSVAGDLLRRRAEHGDDADAHTEVYRVGRGGADPATDDYADSDYDDRDYADNDYSDYADGEYDDDYDYDDDAEPKPTRASKRAATKAAASRMASRAKSRAASRVAASRVKSRVANRTAASRAESRAGGGESAKGSGGRLARLSGVMGNDNSRQWLILAAQSVGAAVAGMLLFKGFETMWETLPWVALALAMVVILGLVALVRVLRRTDDIFSTVIAVVVGVFVTLGPLAFLLSTS